MNPITKRQTMMQALSKPMSWQQWFNESRTINGATFNTLIEVLTEDGKVRLVTVEPEKVA